MDKREFLSHLKTGTLERLMNIYNVRMDPFDDRQDYIEKLSRSHKATIENIKKVLKM